jgi:hypothetical protein
MLGMGEGYQISDISDQRLAISDQEGKRRGTVTQRSQRKNTEGTEKRREPKTHPYKARVGHPARG